MKFNTIRQKGLLIVAFITTYYPLFAFTQNPTNTGSKEMRKITEFEVFKVHGLNSEYAEFSPVLYKQDFIFASNRQYDFNIIGEDNWSKTSHMNIFKAEVRTASSDSVIATRVKIFDKVFLDKDHTGPICFSADGTEAIFTKVSHRKQNVFGDKTARPQLYTAKLVDGKWTNVVKLPFVKVNYSYGHPSLSTDGKILFYVSDEIGGSGGKDIWMVERNGDSWGEPKSLREINTPGDELFPSIVDDVLYFSTNGRGGKGGLDLFKSKTKNNSWSSPESLGETINTEFDEFAIVFNANRQSGYFSSNRDNGKGDDDIYFFKINEKVLVQDDVIEGQFVYKKLGSDKPTGLDVVLIDEDGNVVMQTKTDANGEFKFRNLDPDKKYVIRLMKDGEEVELILYGKDADSFLLANKEGDFVYRKLSTKSIGTLALIDEENVDPVTRTGTMNGQFVYSKLKKDVPAGIEVFLIDEDGNIVDRTKTDANGNFQFSKLSMDKNYRVKIGDLDDDVNLLVFNKKDQIMAVLAAGKDGVFEYRKLKTDKSNIEYLLLEEEDMQFSDNSMIISGEFSFRKLGNKIANMDYEILDENYLLITKGKTNDKGFFREMYIPAKDQIIFKINGKDYPEDVDLLILDRSKQVVVKLDKNSDGYFVYKKLASSGTQLSIEDEMINSLKGKGVNGQFVFKKLEADKSKDFELYDESGKLIHKGKTDANGFISLTELNPNNFYQFKLLSGIDADLRVWDNEKGEIVLIKKSKNGFYEYGKRTVATVNEIKPEKPIKTETTSLASGKIIQAIYYDKDIYKLGGDSRIKALTIVKFMNDNPTAKIVVSSHSSAEGTEEYNLGLSEKRMKELVDFLIAKGISADRIIGEFHGESKPRIECNGNCSDKQNAGNRRTEVTLIK